MFCIMFILVWPSIDPLNPPPPFGKRRNPSNIGVLFGKLDGPGPWNHTNLTQKDAKSALISVRVNIGPHQTCWLFILVSLSTQTGTLKQRVPSNGRRLRGFRRPPPGAARPRRARSAPGSRPPGKAIFPTERDLNGVLGVAW